MAEYIISVVVASAILGLGAYASYPHFSDKASRLAASVLLLYVAVNPLGKILSDIGGGDFNISAIVDSTPKVEESGEYIEVAEAAFKEGISKLLFTKYEIDYEDAEVKTVGFDFDGMRCEKIKITLYGKALLADFRAIEEYITESGLGECEVYLSIG